MERPQYNRILLKLSGEALMGDQSFGISPGMIKYVAEEVRSVFDLRVQVAIVVGGGNIFRGISAASYGLDRVSADRMGMLATVINSLALQDVLEDRGIQTRVQSAISMHEVAEPFIVRKAIRHLEKGRVVIFAAGTGNPYFTTDTAAVLRAQEIRAEVLNAHIAVSPTDKNFKFEVWEKDPLASEEIEASVRANLEQEDALEFNDFAEVPSDDEPAEEAMDPDDA